MLLKGPRSSNVLSNNLELAVVWRREITNLAARSWSSGCVHGPVENLLASAGIVFRPAQGPKSFLTLDSDSESGLENGRRPLIFTSSMRYLQNGTVRYFTAPQTGPQLWHNTAN